MRTLLAFIPQYLFWHYTRALREMFAVFGDFFWFLYNFFSILLLLRTFFSPFERLGEEYKKGFNIEAILSTFVVNTIMRIVGMMIRALVIALGLLALMFLCGAYIIALILWLIAPFLVLFLLMVGLVGI